MSRLKPPKYPPLRPESPLVNAFIRDPIGPGGSIYDAGWAMWILRSQDRDLQGPHFWRPVSAIHPRAHVPMSLDYQNVDDKLPKLLLDLAKQHGLAECVETTHNRRMPPTLMCHPACARVGTKRTIHTKALPVDVMLFLPEPEDFGWIVLNHIYADESSTKLTFPPPLPASKVRLEYGVMVYQLPRAVRVGTDGFVDLSLRM